ncbi:hypothetical protein [Laspinema olomoucense]|uniref:Uncharacterized protein n=1 Tax=Laspinema olomoucense D3b TaxID=2953688 RepID=A0ABT2NCQ7_9CYAN|nr:MULTISPECIES: hypothetical protein [unclassified Laspinema]MCT7973632.1 hypothetical protein [Laspinema sp. D3d]MCT7979664.1 hypothetical protein [Laspinema sp. D3b]MCT7989320.1 hypothetical protein [Laspinema sp. D3a]MCT7996096.1 hypothetical protein [Laspinema sp. D3c]
MPETEPKPVDFSTAKKPAHSLEAKVDTTAENPNLDPKLALPKTQELQEKQEDGIPPGERMIQQAWMPGGR